MKGAKGLRGEEMTRGFRFQVSGLLGVLPQPAFGGGVGLDSGIGSAGTRDLPNG